MQGFGLIRPAIGPPSSPFAMASRLFPTERKQYFIKKKKQEKEEEK
jgi:hypothetical protein